ncbi:hypothetical protein [Rufibacter sp. LB8]|uniref:hypothetical protein n=1 Tax=Rufibacter sp. LB8 TaxID=2777781 RepID=UPI00178C347F|nr:hypothetical protein [Rufibacter sp. LB8]
MFIFIFLIVLFGIPSILIFLSYWIPKKLGYIKFGKTLSRIVFLCFACLALYIFFEDEFFTKGDAEKLLQEQQIILKDDFSLLNNKSMSAIGDYYHKFTLKISSKDKARIITEIKRASNFKTLDSTDEDILNFPYNTSNDNRYKGPILRHNYETKDTYKRDLFKPNGEGYAPTYRVITINKKGNELIFEDIDE